MAADAAIRLGGLEMRVKALEQQLATKDARIATLEGELAVLECRPWRIACFGSSSKLTPQKYLDASYEVGQLLAKVSQAAAAALPSTAHVSAPQQACLPALHALVLQRVGTFA